MGGKANMRAVIQRVEKACVKVADSEIANIGRGILALVAIGREDSTDDLEWMAKKIVELRIFDDEAGRLNRGLLDIRGQLLIVSQFTLYGDCRKGRRPSYSNAAQPAEAQTLYDAFVDIARRWVPDVQRGRFQAVMEVELINSGPVTIILDSR